MTQLEIDAFLAVVKHGNISTAAKNLYISQPALTRRIQIMENELGYPLFIRKKGERVARLTAQGRCFHDIAWKWQKLWSESTDLVLNNDHTPLLIASVGSFNQYMMPYVAPQYLANNHRLQLFCIFSEEAYRQMESGLFDLAFIEMQDYTTHLSKGILSKPAYIESFVIVSRHDLPQHDGCVELAALNPEKEIYLKWNKEFVAWHDTVFYENKQSYIILDDVTMAHAFLKEDYWFFASYTMGEYLKKQGANVYMIHDGPPRQIIYYLTQSHHKEMLIEQFLHIIHTHIETLPHDKIESLLF